MLGDVPSAYFRLNDTGSVVSDSSGHGHNSSFPDGASHTAPGALVGDADGALQVDELDGLRVASDGLPRLDASQTVEAWVRLDSALRDASVHVLVALNDVQLQYYSAEDSDTLSLAQPHGGVAAVVTWNIGESPSVADGDWHQVAYTFAPGMVSQHGRLRRLAPAFAGSRVSLAGSCSRRGQCRMRRRTSHA